MIFSHVIVCPYRRWFVHTICIVEMCSLFHSPFLYLPISLFLLSLMSFLKVSRIHLLQYCVCGCTWVSEVLGLMSCRMPDLLLREWVGEGEAETSVLEEWSRFASSLLDSLASSSNGYSYFLSSLSLFLIFLFLSLCSLTFFFFSLFLRLSYFIFISFISFFLCFPFSQTISFLSFSHFTSKLVFSLPEYMFHCGNL